MPFAIDEERLASPDMQQLDINNPPRKQIAHQEFPRMVYLHPKDKTKEHRTKVVNDAAEQKEAESKGWKSEPHIPVEPAEDLSVDFEAESGDPLDGMTKAELVEYAKSKGIPIDLADKKEVILAAIKAA